jgi:threonine dehydrogenase-like Zn-dependent dehydrogenase
MGLLALQAAIAHGAATVLTTARRPQTQRVSESLGAEASVSPDDPAAIKRISAFRPDFVIDAAGGPPEAGLAGNSALETAMNAVVPYGTVLELSDLAEPIRLDPQIREKSVRLVFGQSSYYYGLYPHTLALLADGRMRCEPLVTHEIHGIENLRDVLEVKINRTATQSIQVQLVLD